MDGINIAFIENPNCKEYYSKLFKTPTIFPLLQVIKDFRPTENEIIEEIEKRKLLGRKQIKNKLKDFTNFGLLKIENKSYSLTVTGRKVLNDLHPLILKILGDVVSEDKDYIEKSRREKYKEMCNHIVDMLEYSIKNIPTTLDYYFDSYQKDLYKLIKEYYEKQFNDAIMDYLSIYDSLSLSMEDYLEALYSVKGVKSCNDSRNFAEENRNESYPEIIRIVDSKINDKFGKEMVEKHKKTLILRLKKNKEIDLIGFLKKWKIEIKEFCKAIHTKDKDKMKTIRDKLLHKPTRAPPILRAPPKRAPMRLVYKTQLREDYRVRPDQIINKKIINEDAIKDEDDLDKIREYYRIKIEINKLKEYIDKKYKDLKGELLDQNEITLLELCLTHLEVDLLLIEESKKDLFVEKSSS